MPIPEWPKPIKLTYREGRDWAFRQVGEGQTIYSQAHQWDFIKMIFFDHNLLCICRADTQFIFIVKNKETKVEVGICPRCAFHIMKIYTDEMYEDIKDMIGSETCLPREALRNFMQEQGFFDAEIGKALEKAKDAIDLDERKSKWMRKANGNILKMILDKSYYDCVMAREDR